MNRPKPLIGQTIKVYGLTCVIIDIEDYGTHGNLIVVTQDGERWYRVSGQSCIT